MYLEDIAEMIGTMIDIVKDGIDSYKSDEKLEELIKKSVDDYEDLLSNSDKKLYKKYLAAKKNYEDEFNEDDKNNLLEKMEMCQVKYLEALIDNSSLPKEFRDEIKNAIVEFKKVNNMALEKMKNKILNKSES